MTCQQCGADLPELATFCYKCGTPVRAAAFSYVPAGAPPWPETIPPFARSQSNTALPVQTKESELASQAREARRSRRGILSLIAFLILTPILGVGITLGALYANGQFPPHSAPKTAVKLPAAQPTSRSSPAATPSTQSNSLPTPTTFQAIDATSSTKLGVTIKYPGDWIVSALQATTSSTSIDIHPQQQLGIDMYIERLSANASATITSTSDVNQSIVNSISQTQGISNVQIVTSSVSKRTIGGAQWNEVDATFMNANGLLFHFTTIAVQHNHIYYDMQFYSPDSNYSEAVQKYFQPMFDSFKFLT